MISWKHPESDRFYDSQNGPHVKFCLNLQIQQPWCLNTLKSIVPSEFPWSLISSGSWVYKSKSSVCLKKQGPPKSSFLELVDFSWKVLGISDVDQPTQTVCTPSTIASNHWLYCSIGPTHSGKRNTSPLSVWIDLHGVWPFSSFFYITGPTEESMPRRESNWSTWSNKVDSLVSLLVTKGHQDLGLDKALSSEASKSTGMAQGCFTRLRRCFNSRDHDVWSKSLQPSMWSLEGPSSHRSS